MIAAWARCTAAVVKGVAIDELNTPFVAVATVCNALVARVLVVVGQALANASVAQYVPPVMVNR